MTRYFAAFLLLSLPVLFGCEKHDPRVTRAFWDRDYEHQLHETGEVPDYTRLFVEGSVTAKEGENLAEAENYLSKLREDPLYEGVPALAVRPSLDDAPAAEVEADHGDDHHDH